MKAKSILFAAAIILQGSLLFAGISETKSSSVSGEFTIVEMNILAPVTPFEATFEEVAATAESLVSDFSVLSPVTPAEATFTDAIEPGASMPEVNVLAPVTPAVADFETV